ncbi:MAG: hypothetical protein ACI82F_002678 [Planctomycetota bacterium]|jgi:hypothetical protein
MNTRRYQSGRRVLVALCGLVTTISLNAADVSIYSVTKGKSFKQTGPGTVSVSDADKYVFQVQVIAASPNSISSASVRLQNTEIRPLLGASDTRLSFATSFAPGIATEMQSLADLDAGYPNGVYPITIVGANDGVLAVTLTVTGDDYPSTPEVINFSDAQIINPAATFRIQWAPFTGGSQTDVIILTLAPKLDVFGTQPDSFQTPAPGNPGALNGADTEVIIPAGTLLPGTVYRASLFFGKVTELDTSSLPGATGLSGYSATTRLDIQTTGTATSPTITSQPESQTVTTGAQVMFGVAASGLGPFSYIWHFQGGPIFPFQTEPMLTLNDVQSNDAGDYHVVVYNPSGSIMSQVATLAVDQPGIVMNKVLWLDGVGDYVTIPSSSQLQNATEFTLEAWIKPSVIANGATGFVFNKGDGQTAFSQRSYELRWGTNDLHFFLFLGTLTYATVAAPAPEGQWVHFAATYQSNPGLLTVYTNGVLAALDTLTANGQQALRGLEIRQTTLPLEFGASNHRWEVVDAELDEVRIWSRALSGIEIRQRMLCRLVGDEPGLSAYWNFDDATLTDLTGNGHNGTALGDAAVVDLVGDDIIHWGYQPLFTGLTRSMDTITLFLKGRPGVSYQVDGSADLTTWNTAGVIQNQTGAVQAEFPVVPGTDWRFYRAAEVQPP